jgi:hypothetical protein
MRTKDSIDNCVCYQDYIVELEVAHEEIKRLCEAFKLILNANSLNYAQEIAAKALEEKK